MRKHLFYLRFDCALTFSLNFEAASELHQQSTYHCSFKKRMYNGRNYTLICNCFLSFCTVANILVLLTTYFCFLLLHFLVGCSKFVFSSGLKLCFLVI